MTYEPKTTREQRQLLRSQATALHPELRKHLMGVLDDLEQAEAYINEMLPAALHAVEPAHQIGEWCLHPNAEWDTTRVRPTRVCTTCGEEVGNA